MHGSSLIDICLLNVDSDVIGHFLKILPAPVRDIFRAHVHITIRCLLRNSVMGVPLLTQAVSISPQLAVCYYLGFSTNSDDSLLFLDPFWLLFLRTYCSSFVSFFVILKPIALLPHSSFFLPFSSSSISFTAVSFIFF